MKKFIALLLFITGATAAGTAWAGRIVIPSPDDISLDAIPVCYDFGCKNRATVNLPPGEWKSVADWFVPAAATPAGERAQIKNAIGWMEVVIGRHTPTHKDLAFDLPANDDDDGIFPGQLDCIDEAVNTTSYLKLFEMHGLLKHHVVLEAAYRRSLFDQHWAGQVREKQTGKRFVVDSWFQPNGYLAGDSGRRTLAGHQPAVGGGGQLPRRGGRGSQAFILAPFFARRVTPAIPPQQFRGQRGGGHVGGR